MEGSQMDYRVLFAGPELEEPASVSRTHTGTGGDRGSPVPLR